MVLKHNVIREVFEHLYNDGTEVYFEMKPYYCQRLLLYKGKEKSQVFWQQHFNKLSGHYFRQWIKEAVENGTMSFKNYDSIEIVNGMKLGVKAPIIKRHIDYITTGFRFVNNMPLDNLVFIVACSNIIYKSLTVKG